MKDRIKSKRSYRIYISLTLMLGITASIILFLLLQEAVNYHKRIEFEKEIDPVIYSIQNKIEDLLHNIDMLNKFIYNKADLHDNEFRDYTSSIFSVNKEIFSLAWAQDVSRNEFFPVRTRNDIYIPVRFMESQRRNDGIVSNELIGILAADLLEHLLENDLSLATLNVIIPGNLESFDCYLIFSPVYLKNNPTSTYEERKKNFRGFAIGCVDVADIARELNPVMKSDIAVEIWDLTDGYNNRLIYKNDKHLILKYSQIVKFRFASRLWMIKCSPDWKHAGTNLNYYLISWIALACGILSTILLTLFLWRYLRDEFSLRMMVEERILTTLNSIEDAVILTNEEGDIIEMNIPAEKIIGKSFASVKNAPIEDLFTILDIKSKKQVINPIRDAIKNRTPIKLSSSHLLMDFRNRLIPISDTVSPVYSQKGEFTGVLFVFRDISKEYDAQEKINDAYQRQKTIMASMPAFVYMKDKSLNYMLANEAARDIYGTTEENIIGKRDSDFLSKEVADHFEDQDRLVLSSGRPSVNLEEKLTRSTGEFMWCLSTKIPVFNSKNDIIGIVGTILDITARRKSELELQRAQTELQKQTIELTRSNRELENFAYVASHDLKAPLRAIDNLSLWIEEDLGEIVQGQTKEYLSLLRKRVKRMENLLNSLLEYSRVGKVQENLEFVDVNKLISEIIAMLSPPEDVSIRIISDMPSFITARAPLQCVLMNLVNNAIKHRNDKAVNITLSCVEKDGCYQFSVKDNGPGIPEEYHEKIFKLFQTLKPRDEVEGSGMGLAIVKKTLESLGSTISLDSSLDSGADFIFTWPKTLDRNPL